MCTNSDSTALNLNVNIETVKTIVSRQIETIVSLGAEPEAIYMEKGMFDTLVESILENSGLSPEDVEIKRYNGIPVFRMDDVRNMNHHQYFKGWAIPVQVTVKPNTYPKSAEQIEAERLEELKGAFLNNSRRVIGLLPENLKALAIIEAGEQGVLARQREIFGAEEFDIDKVSVNAMDWSSTEQGHSFWSNVYNGKFPTEETVESMLVDKQGMSEEKKADMEHVWNDQDVDRNEDGSIDEEKVESRKSYDDEEA